MPEYADITSQLTDQWVAAIERAKAALPDLDRGINLFPAGFTMPDAAKKLTAELPSVKEVVEANFQVAQRLLEAQRDFTLAVVERTLKATAPASE
ncbi:MAG: hypothetical protein QM662_15890 [Gordonia sp. (in: high G+C Gram-positive bacteria)]